MLQLATHLDALEVERRALREPADTGRGQHPGGDQRDHQRDEVHDPRADHPCLRASSVAIARMRSTRSS